ncbi:MAG: transporter substrate-binding domain-containing protein [Bacteroidota bacterium]
MRPKKIFFSLFTAWMFLGLPSTFAQDSLLVAIHENPPFVIKNEAGEYEGLSIELWKNIAKDLGLRYEFKYYYDLVSIVKDLEYREIDLTINPMDVTALRVQKFDATQPYFISSIGLAAPYANESQLQMFIGNFFSINFLEVVLLLIFIIFIFGAILWTVERKENRQQFRPGILGLLDGLWWSAVTMTTVGYGDKAPKTLAGKAVAIVWMFTAVIIISSFTATIASTLTIGRLDTDIESLEQLKSVEEIATVSASTGEDYLLINDIVANKKYQNPLQALRALRQREADALVYDRTALQYLIKNYSFNEQLQLLPIRFNNQYESFLFPKNHPAFNAVNAALVKEIQKLDWQQMLQKYGLGE